MISEKYCYNAAGYKENGENSTSSGRWIKGYDPRVNYNCYIYDEDGFDKDGYDGYGYDRKGYDRDGYDRDGYDRLGYNRLGYNRFGYKWFDKM